MLLYSLVQADEQLWYARLASDLPGPDGTAELRQFCTHHSLRGELRNPRQFKERFLVRGTSDKQLRKRLRGPTFAASFWGAVETDARGFVQLIVQAKRRATHALWADPARSLQRSRRPKRDVQRARTWRLLHHTGPTPPHPVGRPPPPGWRPTAPWWHLSAHPRPNGQTLDTWARPIEVFDPWRTSPRRASRAQERP